MSNIYRRDFLKGQTLTSAALFLPGVLVLGREDSPSKINHLIGLGTASYQVFLTLQGRAGIHKMTVLDTEIPEEESLKIELYPLKDQDMQKDRLITIFDDLFNADDIYFIVAGLRGRTGNALFVNLAEWMQAHHKDHRLTAIMPFHFEGQQAMLRCNEALSKVCHQDNLSIIELETFRSKHGNLPLQSAMELAHLEVLKLWDIDKL